MTLFVAVFAVTLMAGLAFTSRLAARKPIDEPLQEGRAQNSAVSEFLDDLLRHRWIAIIALAVLVALDRHWRFSGGFLQSRMGLSLVVVAIFAGRLLMRRATPAATAAGGSPSTPAPAP